eukprot:jgi/Psemu1/185187/e_gw1.47.121.1
MHAHFDCFSGAAGDMLLASCLDASASTSASGEGESSNSDPDWLKDHVTDCLRRGIPALADEFEIRTKRVWRGAMGSIAGLHVTVISKYHDRAAPVPKRGRAAADADTDDARGHDHEHASQETKEQSHEHQHDHSNDDDDDDHSHNHSHGHSHGHSHHHSHGHSHSHRHSSSSSHHSDGPLRNLPEIRRLLEESDDRFIDPWVKSMAIKTFTELAKAEAKTHGADSIDAVHFHEVGAVDSIVDTVGTLIALHCLGVRTFSCSRLPIGEGTVWTDHGILPVPAPATLRLLAGMPVCPGPSNGSGITGELVTPTGAALLRALCLTGGCALPAVPTGRPPAFTPRAVGIGAGTKDFEKHPNIVRLLIGDDVVGKN